MQDNNEIYQFMKANSLTDKDEKTFLNEYSNPQKAKELYSFFQANKLTDKDETSFYDTYLKKKEPSQSSATKLPLPNQPINPLQQGANIVGGGVISDISSKAPKGSIKEAALADKKNNESYLGALWNNAVGSVARLAGGAARATYQLSGNPVIQMERELLDRAGKVMGKNLLAEKEKEYTDAVKGVIEKGRTSASSKEYERKIAEGFDVTNGLGFSDLKGAVAMIPQFAADMGLAIGTGGSSFAIQGYDDALSMVDEIDEGRNMSEGTRIGFGLGGAVIFSVLDKLGLDNLVKTPAAKKYVTAKVIKEATEELAKKGAKVTAEQFENTVKDKASKLTRKELAKIVAKRGVKGAGIEGVTELAQEGAIDLLKIAANKLEGSQIFNEEEIKNTAAKRYINSFAAGGILGGGGATVAARFQNTESAIKSKLSEAKTIEDIDGIVAEINDNVVDGTMTQEEADNVLPIVQNFVEVSQKVPETLSGKNKVEAVDLISERENLAEQLKQIEEQKAAIDPAFHNLLDGDAKQIEERVNEINKELGELAKPENNVEEAIVEEEIEQPKVKGTEPEISQPIELSPELPIEEGESKKEIIEYNGVFNPKKTGIIGLDDLLEDDGYNFFYKGVQAKVEMMSPDEYLSKVRKGFKEDKDVNVTEDKKESIKKAIEKGNKINMPFLSTKDGKFSQEGRNRAVVAKELGEEKIPVLIESDVSFEDKINKGKEYINDALNDGAKNKEEIITNLRSKGIHRDGINFIDNNFDEIVPKELKSEPVKKQKVFAQKDLDRAKAKKIHQRVKEMEAPSDASQIALRYIADGGKVSEQAKGEDVGNPALRDVESADKAFIEAADKVLTKGMKISRDNGFSPITGTKTGQSKLELTKEYLSQLASPIKQFPSYKEYLESLLSKEQTIEASIEAVEDADKARFEIIDERMSDNVSKNLFNETKGTIGKKMVDLKAKINDAIKRGISKWGSKKEEQAYYDGSQSEKMIDVPNLNRSDIRSQDGIFEKKENGEFELKPNPKYDPQYAADLKEIESLKSDIQNLHDLNELHGKDYSYEDNNKLQKRLGSLVFGFGKGSEATKTRDAFEAHKIMEHLKSEGVSVDVDKIISTYKDADASEGQIQKFKNNAAEITEIINNKGMKKQEFSTRENTQKQLPKISEQTIVSEKGKGVEQNPILKEEPKIENKIENKIEEVKVEEPIKVEDKKEPKKISDKAREQAAKLRSGEANVLPDWLRANLPKGTKKQGADINDVYAKALEVFADTYDKLNDFKKAVDEAFKGISDWFKENNIDIDEADIKAKFEAQLKGEKAEESTEERRFTKQMLATEGLIDKERLADTLKYVKQTNALSIEEANKIIDEIGLDEAFILVQSDAEMNGGVRGVLSQMLISRYNNLARTATNKADKQFYWDKTVEVANFVTKKLATESGRIVQSFSIWGKLSPEALIRSAVRDMEAQGEFAKKKAKADVNKIGNKLKKANEEAIDEVLESEEFKGDANKAQSKSKSKAEAKIKAAREKRKNIINKYKGKGGITFTSGGITKEGIEFIGEMAKTYIEEGLANIELIVEKIAENIKEVSGKDATDEILAEVKKIAEKKLTASDTKLIGKGLSDMNVRIADVVKKHFIEAELVKTKLAEKLVSEAGLDGEEAIELANKVRAAFDRIATKKKNQILKDELERLERAKNKLKGTVEVKTRELYDDIIKLTNLGGFDNEQLLDLLANKVGTGKLTREQGERLQFLAQRVKEAPQGSPKNEAIQELFNYQANLKGTSKGEVGQAIWYASLLAGYKTHIKNIVANVFNTIGETVVSGIENPKAASAMVRGLFKGYQRGLVEARNTLKTGKSPIHITKIEASDVLERKPFVGGNKNPFNWLKYVSRFMVASDVFAFQGLKESRAYQMAYMEAAKMKKEDAALKDVSIWRIINDKLLDTPQRKQEAELRVKAEGQIGVEAKRRMYELMEQSRPEKMQDETYNYAARGTFNYQPEGALGAINNALAYVLDIPIGGVKPLRFVVPFTRILTNVANNALDYEPITGTIRSIRGKRGFESFETMTPTKGTFREMTPEERKRQIIKAGVGITALSTLYALSKMKDDDDEPLIEITGSGSQDYVKTNQLKERGWKPYSIKVGDTYYSYELTPLILTLGYVGNLNDFEKYDAKSDSDVIDKMSQTAFRMQDAISNMIFIGTLADFMDMGWDNTKTRGQKMQKYLENLAKTSVPFMQPVTQISQGVQEVMELPKKETTKLGYSLIKDIPIARNALYNKINVLGEEIPTKSALIISKKTTNDSWEFLENNRIFLAPINRKTVIGYNSEKGMDMPVTDEQFYNFSKMRGQMIKSVIEGIKERGRLAIIVNGKAVEKSWDELNSGEYKQQVDDFLEDVASKATKKAKEEIFLEKEEPENLEKQKEKVKRKNKFVEEILKNP